MKLLTNNTFIWAVIIIGTVALAVVMTLIFQEEKACMLDPFTYGAKKSYENDLPLQCICDIRKTNVLGFDFNESGLRPHHADYIPFKNEYNLTPIIIDDFSQ